MVGEIVDQSTTQQQQEEKETEKTKRQWL